MTNYEKTIAINIANSMLKRIEYSITNEIENMEVDFYNRVPLSEASKRLEVPVDLIEKWIEKDLISSVTIGRRKYVLLKLSLSNEDEKSDNLFDKRIGVDDDLPF